MSDAYYNIISWVMIMAGLIGLLAMLLVVFWIIYEEINK
jgi:hypothetical protein